MEEDGEGIIIFVVDGESTGFGEEPRWFDDFLRLRAMRQAHDSTTVAKNLRGDIKVCGRGMGLCVVRMHKDV